MFGGPSGNIEYRLADGSGHNPENPTLAEMTQAALTVLNRDPNGFVLMVEGGAVDWGAHANNMNQMLGEVAGFNAAVQTVVDWVNANDPTWSNTLVIVTADHETGYLTAGPGIFPDQPLGTVNAATVNLEKPTKVSGVLTGRRASWDDANSNDEIDAGETVYWAWNSGSHTNSLVPVYARGAGAGFLAGYATGSDTVRGAYLDNTDVFRLMDAVTLGVPAAAAPEPLLAPNATVSRSDADVVLTWPPIAGATGYEVWRGAVPYLNPGDEGATLFPIIAPTAAYTHTAALGFPGTATFYTVRTRPTQAASRPSPRAWASSSSPWSRASRCGAHTDSDQLGAHVRMSEKASRKMPQFRSVLLVLCLVVAPVILPPATSAALGGPSPAADAQVWEALARGELADVLILLGPQPDLSPAQALPTKEARGRWVYETLRAAAERDQAPVVAELTRAGVPYRRFWAANTVQAQLNVQQLPRVLALPGVTASRPTSLFMPLSGRSQPMLPLPL